MPRGRQHTTETLGDGSLEADYYRGVFVRFGSKSLIGLVVLASVLAYPSGAQALTTFGADLNRPANSGFDCGAGPGAGAFGQLVLYPTNATTCTWLAAGRNFGQAENTLVPQGQGTITNVRVRVGPITGPMQVVVLRSVRQGVVNPNPAGETPGGFGANVACCREVGRSAPFVPAPNAASNIAVALPVKADITPNPISGAFDFDALGLSVLGPGVPIPAHDTGDYQNVLGPTAAAYFPALTPGQERADSFGTLGFQPLLQADWEPVVVAGGAAGSSPAVLTLVAPVASISRGFLLLSLRCNQATPCVGALNVQNRGAAAAVAEALAGVSRKPKTITLARAKFNIPAGKTKKVRARLTRKGRKALKRRKAKFYVNTRIGGKLVLSAQIKIKKKK